MVCLHQAAGSLVLVSVPRPCLLDL